MKLPLPEAKEEEKRIKTLWECLVLVSTSNVMLYILMKKAAEQFFNEIICEVHKAWEQLLWSFRINSSLDGGDYAYVFLSGANFTIKSICAVPVLQKRLFV